MSDMIFDDEDINTAIEAVSDENVKAIENKVEKATALSDHSSVLCTMFNFTEKNMFAILNTVQKKELVINKIMEKINSGKQSLAELTTVYKLLADDIKNQTMVNNALFVRTKDGGGSPFTDIQMESPESKFLENISSDDLKKFEQMYKYMQEASKGN